MGFLNQIKDKFQPQRQSLPPRNALPVRRRPEQTLPVVEWNEPTAVMRSESTQGESAHIDSIQERQREDDRFMYSDTVPDARLLAQQGTRSALHPNTRTHPVRDHAEPARGEQKTAHQRMLQRQDNASTPNVRRLRQLVREKYRLDVYVWDRRGVQRAIRPSIQKVAEKSDATLKEIMSIVKEWDRDAFSDPEEWRLAKKIKDGLMKDDGRHHLSWEQLPAWNRDEDDDWSEH